MVDYNPEILKLTTSKTFNHPLALIANLQSALIQSYKDFSQVQRIVEINLSFCILQTKDQVNVMADFTSLVLKCPPPESEELVLGAVEMFLTGLKIQLLNGNLPLGELMQIAALCDKSLRLFGSKEGNGSRIILS